MIWNAFAWLVTRPQVTAWLYRRAIKRPYTPIISRDGRRVYMERFWLFNPYPANEEERMRRGWLGNLLPSARLHHIRLPDDDAHLHDHPWDARTIILSGEYIEQLDDAGHKMRYRPQGYTGPVLFGQYHRIHWVPEEGVWTLFITWRYRGTWGFRVNGQKVPYKEYLKERDNE